MIQRVFLDLILLLKMLATASFFLIISEFEEQLPDNETKRTITLTVDFQKMEQEDEDLGESIRLYYYRLQPFIERAAKDFVRERMSAFVWF